MQYGEAIRNGFNYLLDSDKSVIVIGQGLWSPWYVGDTMRDLEKFTVLKELLTRP